MRIFKSSDKGIVALLIIVLAGAIVIAGGLAFWKFFQGPEEGAPPESPRASGSLKAFIESRFNLLAQAGAECETKFDLAVISDDVLDRAFEECSSAIDQKIEECSGREGWLVDVQIGLKEVEDIAKEENEVYEAVCRGGCSGEGAGDSRPLHIKGETIDIQEGTQVDFEGGVYEIFCSVACSHWDCPKEPPPPPTCGPGEYSSYKECERLCSPHVCDTTGETYPYCYVCVKKDEPLPEPEPENTTCNVDKFYACIDDGCDPRVCIAACPFLPSECPPDSGPDVVKCEELDQSCVEECLALTTACENACLKANNCARDEVPPRFQPDSE